MDKGMCADVAFHDKGDSNPHAHILLTMHPLIADGKWGDKSRLEYILDGDGNRIPAKQKGRWKTRKVSTTDWDDRGNVERGAQLLPMPSIEPCVMLVSRRALLIHGAMQIRVCSVFLWYTRGRMPVSWRSAVSPRRSAKRTGRFASRTS